MIKRGMISPGEGSDVEPGSNLHVNRTRERPQIRSAPRASTRTRPESDFALAPANRIAAFANSASAEEGRCVVVGLAPRVGEPWRPHLGVAHLPDYFVWAVALREIEHVVP